MDPLQTRKAERIRALYSALSLLRKWLLESAALDLRHFLDLF